MNLDVLKKTISKVTWMDLSNVPTGFTKNQQPQASLHEFRIISTMHVGYK